MLHKFFHVITGRAFKWDPLDETVPLHLRFMNRKICVCSIGYKHIILGTAHFSAGNKSRPFGLQISDIKEVEVTGPIADMAKSAVKEYCAPRKLAFAAALCSEEWTCARKENHTFTRSDYEKFMALRSVPTEVIGDRADPNSMYCLINNPSFNTSLVFTFNNFNNRWSQCEEYFAQTDVTLVRLQSGCATMLDYLVHYEKDRLTEISSLLIIDRHAFLFLPVEGGGKWAENISFRNDGGLIGMGLFTSLGNIADRMRISFEQVIGPKPLIIDCSEVGFDNWARSAGAKFFPSGTPPAQGQKKYFELEALCHG